MMPSSTAPAIPPKRDSPKLPVVMYQRWHELLFLHWSVDPGEIQGRLPDGLKVDCFDGRAWVGVVPFHMRGVRPRFLPALPGLSNFPELNLRTYVCDQQGRPGVWFFSLDTNQRMANWIARNGFHLNYQLASMRSHTHSDGRISYTSKRAGNHPPQQFDWMRYGPARIADAGSLEFFLVERYRLFAYNEKRKRLYSGRVQHTPYPIQAATLYDYSDQLFELNQLPLPGRPPDSILASPGVAVKVYPLIKAC